MANAENEKLVTTRTSRKRSGEADRAVRRKKRRRMYQVFRRPDEEAVVVVRFF